ncbi:MAG: FAD:protein FMN transferase [Gammaproteobacteria bacterium]|nr:FAD:protein FMN transferase [Gammaproteobacteria bacterium]MDH5730087.1 FAD:protein FMN transferase [Gammaproteobacteria bacterium]
MYTKSLYRLNRVEEGWRGSFSAMACPCEVFMTNPSRKKSARMLDLAFHEAKRIEEKFSRYRDDNIIFKINNAQGEAIKVDDETARLLDYADQCFQLSEGKFDVTSGVLRAAWKFDGSDNIPTQERINSLLEKIGWQKVRWQAPYVQLPAGMEIDLGGIGKEYAVDRTALMLAENNQGSVLVNFGGDIFVSGPRADGSEWRIGVDDAKATGLHSVGEFRISRGGLATSGDARRFLLKDGVRYSHILNPQTGWPVKNAARAVTVLADTCIEAGMLATFAMLEGELAREFLDAQEINYWLQE